MRKHIPHPVTRQHTSYAELDIIHGGDERTALEESLVIAHDLREVLKDGENILHVNMLVDARRLEGMMGKRFEHGARRGRNFFITYLAHSFFSKLDAIKGIVEAREIRYLILTGFELAVITSRHRVEFMAWIRMMRNAGVNVILFTMSMPGNYGALGALRYSARSVNEVGAYLKHNEAELNEQLSEQLSEQRSEQLSEREESEVAEKASESEHESEFSDTPSSTRIYDTSRILFYDEDEDDEPQHSDTDLLKTKDLALEMV